MVPWPLVIFITAYAVFATTMAGEAWRVWQGRSLQPLLALPLAWCAVMSALALGFSFLRPWARRLAVGVSIFLLVGALSASVLAVLRTPPSPPAAFWGTIWAGVQLLVIRYLTRPHVKRWFSNRRGA